LVYFLARKVIQRVTQEMGKFIQKFYDCVRFKTGNRLSGNAENMRSLL